ncbi:MAG TPA: extracellular solute-binding protein [Candidatus Binatia bacterium]|jgi:iron(III) transport system substrate-binding protein
MNHSIPTFQLFSCLLLLLCPVGAEAADWQAEWQKALEGARREGQLVVAISPNPELRKEWESILKQKFGIAIEVLPGRGPETGARIVKEVRAGVHYIDVYFFGGCGGVTLIHEGVLEPLAEYMILPEVADAKNWWGGHMWMDNVSTRRYFYSFVADGGQSSVWYNSDLLKPEELRSYDELLSPKLRGKIGLLDPRTPGGGQSTWAHLWRIKGEDFLRKLVKQDLFMSRNRRQLAEALAHGKVAVTFGVSVYEYQPFVKAGLPVRKLPSFKEGEPASSGAGNVGIVKAPPHPNATKVFLNWFLGKEGQELWTKVMEQPTRRADVETKWLLERGIDPAKDTLTVEQFLKLQNSMEDRCLKVRDPASKFAETILK